MTMKIPMTVTKIRGQEYPVNLYYKQFHKDRVVHLNGVVNTEMAENIITQLLYLDRMETQDIILLINSPGGSVADGMAIYDCMQCLESDVVTVAMGMAASMGAFLLAAGTKGKRYALPHVRIMLHQPLGKAEGQAADISIEAENILYMRKMLNTLLADHTGQPIEKVEQDTDRNNYMTAEEALAYGLIDHVGFCRDMLKKVVWETPEKNGVGWPAAEEIKAVLQEADGTVGGSVLYREEGKKYVYGGDGHSIVLGTSGYGKTSCMMQATVRELGNAGESMILADPKGDLNRAHEAYLREKGYEIIVFDFRHLYQSTRWDPLRMIRKYLQSGNPEKVETGERMLRELAKALFRKGQENDPFWINSSQNLFMGLVRLLLDHAELEEVNLVSVFRMIIAGEESAGFRTYLHAFLEEVVQEQTQASDLLHAYVDTAKETKGSIRSVFESNLAPFVYSKALQTFLCGEDAFDISELKDDRPIAIFVILNDQSKAYDEIASVLLGQLIQHYISLADDSKEGKLKHRMNVLLEELGNIGHCLGDLDRWMSGARSRNVRFHLVLQSYYSQLDDLYGRSAAQTIRSNIKVLAAFCVNDLDTLRYLSELCGETEVQKGNTIRLKPLLTPAELHTFGVGKVLIFAEGLKFIQQMPFYDEEYDTVNWKAPAKREANYDANIRIFPLKERVDQALQKKLNQITEQMEELGMKAAENSKKWEDKDFEADEDMTFCPAGNEEYQEELFARCINDIHPAQRRMIIRKKEQLMSVPFLVRLSGVNEKNRCRVVDILEQFGFAKEDAERYADTEGAEIPVQFLPKALDLVEILRNARSEAFLIEDIEG